MRPPAYQLLADELRADITSGRLQPGERLPEPDWMEQARREHEAEERQYNEPDRRPRDVDWSDREDRQPDGGWTEDDIPF